APRVGAREHGIGESRREEEERAEHGHDRAGGTRHGGVSLLAPRAAGIVVRTIFSPASIAVVHCSPVGVSFANFTRSHSRRKRAISSSGGTPPPVEGKA